MKLAVTGLLLSLCLLRCANSQVHAQGAMRSTSPQSVPTEAASGRGAAKDKLLTLEAGELSLTLDLSRGGGIRSLKYRLLDVVSTQYDQPTSFAIDVVRGRHVRRFDNRDFRSFIHEEVC